MRCDGLLRASFVWQSVHSVLSSQESLLRNLEVLLCNRVLNKALSVKNKTTELPYAFFLYVTTCFKRPISVSYVFGMQFVWKIIGMNCVFGLFCHFSCLHVSGFPFKPIRSYILLIHSCPQAFLKFTLSRTPFLPPILDHSASLLGKYLFS